jgi:hypothetical protein
MSVASSQSQTFMNSGASGIDAWQQLETFSTSSSPPALEMADTSFNDDDYRRLTFAPQNYQFPEPGSASNKASPSSSVEAVDDENDHLDPLYADTVHHWPSDIGLGTPTSDDGNSPNRLDSPAESSMSEMNPFADSNIQKHDDNMDMTEIPQQSPHT